MDECSARSSLDEGNDKLYRALHLLCRHRRGQWHWHLPMCIFFIWILVPIEILLCILVPSNAQMVRPTRVNVVAHIP
jgi:hypothetical protein